ncbi:MAG: hypothetical protein ACI8X3_001988 [Saprospiraceae bacterium]|jgi:hypothetical protein
MSKTKLTLLSFLFLMLCGNFSSYPESISIYFFTPSFKGEGNNTKTILIVQSYLHADTCLHTTSHQKPANKQKSNPLGILLSKPKFSSFENEQKKYNKPIPVQKVTSGTALCPTPFFSPSYHSPFIFIDIITLMHSYQC